MNATDMRLSNARRARRASQGVVSNLGTSSTTGENSRSYSRRVNQRSYAQGARQSAWFKNFSLIVILIVAVVAVGFFVASRVFFGLTGSRLALNDDSVNKYLTAANNASPYYTLVVADLDETNNCDTDVDMVILARMDEKGKALTCISLPKNLKASLSDGASHVLGDAVYVGGYGELLRAVITLSDVDISHIITLNQKGIESMVDSWGGIQWNVVEEVDDPTAGSMYIPAGNQTLTGAQLTTLLRAKNFAKGLEQQGLNQCAFVAQLLQHSSAGSLTDAVVKLDSTSKYLKTDWGSESFMGMLQSYGGFNAGSAFSAQIPCYQTGTTMDSPYAISTSSWQTMMAFVNVGADPQEAVADKTVAVDPQSFSIMVKNGSGIDGGATALANTLTSLGFNVEATGNTDTYVYKETLVIYLDDDYEPAAKSVVKALGAGRVIDGTNHYTFDTDVLVILGSDWMPQS